MHYCTLLRTVLFGVAVCCATAAWAQAPGDAPPVRQDIGMMDTDLESGLVEADCRVCHNDSDPNFPDVEDRHHAVMITDPTVGCLDCHTYEVDGDGNNVFVVNRDCIECHTDSPHHRRPEAVARHCTACHGDLVDDFDDGHRIPTYNPSLVTPYTGFHGDGYYPDGSPEMENLATGAVDIAVGSYPGSATTGLVLVSTGANNDIFVDHTSRSSSASFTVVVTHNAAGDPTATCTWSAGGGTAGTLTIGFESGVTTAQALIDAIEAERVAVAGDSLTASPSHTQGEGTGMFPDTHYEPEGGLPLNNRGFGAGSCSYCHDADDGAGLILDNHDTHHAINLPDYFDDPAGLDPTYRKCELCHDYQDGNGTYHDNGGATFALHIRKCEECHGLDSLHNIQGDSDGGGVVVGSELSGYGHVGRDSVVDTDGDGTPDTKDSDCWGCHGFSVSSMAMVAAAAASPSGPIVPSLYNVDVKSITAGTDKAVVLSGVAFTNTANGAAYKSNVRLTAADGTSVILPADAVSEGTLAVTIPGTTAPGNYKLSAVKNGQESNPIGVTVVPEVSIAKTKANGPVTITGSGFGRHAEGSGTSVTSTVTVGWGKWAKTAEVSGTVLSWTDTEIVADFGPDRVQDVTVNSVFGTASASVKAKDDSGRDKKDKGKGFGNGFGIDPRDRGFGFGR